jgi:hypothetical protein
MHYTAMSDPVVRGHAVQRLLVILSIVIAFAVSVARCFANYRSASARYCS